jgi:hypothetical protein
MTEKQKESKESTKQKEKEEAAAFFAKKLAGSKGYDDPFYYLWSEFLGGLALVSFKFWVMYLTEEEGFRKSLDADPKAIIEVVLQMWRAKVVAEIDAETERHEEMMKTPHAKMFEKMMPSPDESRRELYKAVKEVEEKARRVLYDGIIAPVAEAKTEGG